MKAGDVVLGCMLVLWVKEGTDWDRAAKNTCMLLDRDGKVAFGNAITTEMAHFYYLKTIVETP